MAAAVALSRMNAVENLPAARTRGEVLARYLHLREISKQHHTNVLKHISTGALLQQGRGLGLAQGKTFVVDDMDQLVYAFDLAIHTAPAGRSRAIDRYAQSARLPPSSDDGLVLEAMRKARFAILSVERRHEVIGLIVKDILRDEELWLVDQGLESSIPDGSLMATRLFAPGSFSMTAGVQVPLSDDLLLDAFHELPQLGRKTPRQAVDDRRFAEAIYRAAIASGITERVAYQDPLGEAG